MLFSDLFCLFCSSASAAAAASAAFLSATAFSAFSVASRRFAFSADAAAIASLRAALAAAFLLPLEGATFFSRGPVCCNIFSGYNRVSKLHDAALAVCSLALMDNALGCSLVERSASRSCRISRSTVLGLYGLTDNADGGLKLQNERRDYAYVPFRW